MTVETPLAYQFILQDDIYLSGKDKQHLKQQPAQVTVADWSIWIPFTWPDWKAP
jgi:hypothetical protein